MPLGTVMPSPNFQGLLNGLPVAGGFLHTYRAGTLIPEPTYRDADFNALNDNPVELDSEGKAVVFLSATSYKFLLTTADGDIVPPYPVDGVASTAVTSLPLGVPVYLFFGNSDSPCPTTQVDYPSGITYNELHTGTSIWPFVRANAVGNYVLQAMMMVAGSGSVEIGLFRLKVGPPPPPIVSMSSSSTAGELVESGIIAFPETGDDVDNYGIKIRTVGGVLGFAWAIQIVRK